jgi:fido (protein-threonine AMPylation protein)
MHPPDCPFFEYEHHPHYRERLSTRAARIIAALRNRSVESARLSADTRPVHEKLFQGLTPLDCAYYAGHYRGEDFKCLRYYPIQVPSDPRVGWPPERVLRGMAEIAQILRATLAALDEMHQRTVLTPAEKLIRTVEVACEALVQVFTVHPYGNGNGHAGRFILWAILLRYGYYPNERIWPIEPSPAGSRRREYSALLTRYRDGDRSGLIGFVLQNLVL